MSTTSLIDSRSKRIVQLAHLAIYAIIGMALVVSYNMWMFSSFFYLMAVICLLVPLLYLKIDDEDPTVDEKPRGKKEN